MSSNTTPNESSDHLEQRKTLIKLEAAIDALKLHTLDASQLDELNIKRQPMALNKSSDLKPHFFAPKPNLPQPRKKLIRKTVEHLNNKNAFTDAMSRAYHLREIGVIMLLPTQIWDVKTSYGIRWGQYP